MVQVVDTKPHKSVIKEVVCRSCGATLEYVPNDVQSETHCDYGGGRDLYRFIKCPNCGKKVGVS